MSDTLSTPPASVAISDEVTLVAEDVSITTDRRILAASSHYFKAMLMTSFNETNKDVIHLQDISGENLKNLINFIETSQLTITSKNVETLLTAADLLQIQTVLDKCSDFLKKQLKPDNCLGIHVFAETYNCQKVINAADTYAKEHFLKVIECEEFLNLSIEELRKLVCCDNVAVDEEETVYKAVIAWIKHDVHSRLGDLSSLMSHVRFPLMKEEYLKQILTDEPLIQLSCQCQDFVKEALLYRQQKLRIVLPPEPRCPPPKLLLIFGGEPGDVNTSIEVYDFYGECWKRVEDMPVGRCTHGVGVIEGKVYVAGGWENGSPSHSVDVYNYRDNTWESVADMKTSRSRLGVAVLDNHIYAVGGYNDHLIQLSTAEVYNPISNQWKNIASMSTKRRGVAVGVLGNKLYAVGGWDGKSKLTSVERYSPTDNRWTRVSSLSSGRWCASVGVVGDVLYVVGGWGDEGILKSVEAYNVVRDVWVNVADMVMCRRSAAVVTYGGRLYVLGGYDGRTALSSVEVYNPQNNTWTLLTSTMSSRRCNMAVTLIDKPL